ncbi:MAG: diadenylate cyclase CdaA [Paludibacter sp.]|jgi:uncharacterized protein (TIGR00159 family)|nr:diadenylate cyclase CdaA [Paludibacter sp.]
MALPIGIKDIIDILLVAILLYQTFRLLKRSGAANIFYGILTFIVFWFLVSFVFKMELLGGILDRLVSVGAFGLIVLFQDEIRRFFSNLGSRRDQIIIKFLKKLFGNSNIDKEKNDYSIVQIVLACRNMSKARTGALIVITQANDLNTYIQTGEHIDASISSRLIENIFFKNSPLHDGAMFIANKRIEAAACILPISKNHEIPKQLGLRHRSALGITEISDAISIVVSEETGQISWATKGVITTNVKPEELEMLLSETINN